MAAIGQIRKHSVLLLAMVGGAMLLFVLGGALDSIGGLMSGPNDQVGEINGNKISYQDFSVKVSELEANSRNQVTDEDRQRMRDQVWNNMLQTEILDQEYSALGLSVSDAELMDIIKNDVSNASLNQYFSDPQTGQIVEQYRKPDGSLNGAAVIDYLKKVVFAAENEQSAEAKSSWLNFQENYLRKPAVQNKYNTLLTKGIFLTDADLERTEIDQNSHISFMYASGFYNDIPDEEIEVSDAEMKAYYNAHKTEPAYDQKELTGSISFVSFEVVASEDDKETLQAELTDLREKFKNTDSDTMFVNENGDTPFNIRWAQSGMFPPKYDTTIANGNEGDIFGPFLNLNKFEMVKILQKKMGPDSVKASHILVQIANGDNATAKATIDSLKTVIEANDNFADMAREYSKDPGSGAKGGDLGWFTEGQMVPAFNDACFNGEVGDIVVVTSEFGVHLIKIDEQTEPKAKVLVGIVDNVIEPSQSTYELAYNQASTFAITNDNEEKFVDASTAMNVLVAPNILPSDMTVLSRPNSRQIVRWVFNSEVGSISTPFEIGNEFIVAMVTEIREKGVLPLIMVEDVVKEEVIKEKKAAILVEKMNTPNIKEAASAVGGSIQPAHDISFGSYNIPGLGNEQKLLGMAFSLEIGETSIPIEGDRGVYVVMVESKDIPENVEINDAKRAGIMAASANRANYEAFEALKANAEITDNRFTFF